LFEDELADSITHGCTWLDVGCGHQLLPSWRLQQEQALVRRAAMVIGIDLDFPALREHCTMSHVCMASASQLPFADETFDVVTANMVVEHLDDPIAQFKEIRRVLKRGGTFLFHTPNVFGYTTIAARLVPEALKGRIIRFIEGRAEKDVFPAHYRANSRKRIAFVAQQSGLEVSKFRLIASAAQLVMIPPLVIFELLWIRLLLTPPLRNLRTNIIACLKRSRS
jgi:ubiquinone/menaquinone biosynthesis C-methylase UbiE